jgi:probable phosphoglycerate mutase
VSSTPSPAGSLWLVRHGETEWSASGRHTSRTDVDLTAAGVEAAAALGRRLSGVRFARVLTSPRLRARRTAALSGFADAEVLDDLVEWDYGADEGRTTAEIRTERPGWTVWADGPRDGERHADLRRRADHLVALALAHAADGPVLAFTHGHFARVVGARWVGLDVPAGAHLRLSTASVSVLAWERETPVLQHWNDTGSLG